MGATASKASTAKGLEKLSAWKHADVSQMLQDYKSQDLDFALDAAGLALILSADRELADSAIKAFNCANGLINALSFISGAIVISRGKIEDKANLIFDTFDFDGSKSISMDEMTISLICTLRGVIVLSGINGAVDPTDDEMENISVEAYREFDKNNNQSITKEEYVSYFLKFLLASSSKDDDDKEGFSVEELLSKFNLYKKIPQ